MCIQLIKCDMIKQGPQDMDLNISRLPYDLYCLIILLVEACQILNQLGRKKTNGLIYNLWKTYLKDSNPIEHYWLTCSFSVAIVIHGIDAVNRACECLTLSLMSDIGFKVQKRSKPISVKTHEIDTQLTKKGGMIRFS